MNKDIKAIVFDIGGVIASENNLKEHYIPLCKALNIDTKKFFELRKKYIHLASSGKISGKEMIHRFSKELNLDYNLFLKNWIKFKKRSIRKNWRLEKIIKKLKKAGYKVLSLSGVIDIHYYIGKKKKLYDVFDFNILSFKVGLNKPDIKIYKLLLKKLKLIAKDIIVIDDTKECIESVKKLGINAIMFKTNKQLIKDLKKLGVKI